MAPSTEPIVLAASPATIRLDLACGQSPREGFEGVDIWKGAKHQVDLLRFPWPWADNSVHEINCSHFIEHIPQRETPSGQNLFFAFFDECWRILEPDALMKVVCPNARHNRAFQDPTHCRYIVQETFLYLNKEWRKSQMLDHYDVRCNFGIEVNHIMPIEMTLLHPEAQARRFNESWNVILDWVAFLKKIA
jgi:hypothetical protein